MTQGNETKEKNQPKTRKFPSYIGTQLTMILPILFRMGILYEISCNRHLKNSHLILN